MNLKKCWITDQGADLVTLSFESEHTDFKKLRVRENDFPDNPTPEHPKRHTISLGMLDSDDLLKIYNVLTAYFS